MWPPRCLLFLVRKSDLSHISFGAGLRLRIQVPLLISLMYCSILILIGASACSGVNYEIIKHPSKEEALAAFTRTILLYSTKYLVILVSRLVLSKTMFYRLIEKSFNIYGKITFRGVKRKPLLLWWSATRRFPSLTLTRWNYNCTGTTRGTHFSG